MQLKRDTDYALRILCCLGRQAAEGAPAGAGISLLEISSHAGVPKLSARRICGCLKAKKLLSTKKEPNGAVLYYPGELFPTCSLWDVMSATEDNVHLFAVFDRKSDFFKINGKRLENIQNEIERIFQNTTLAKLTEESDE